MYLQLLRLRDNANSTIGTLHVDGEFECFTLEDTYNEPKVYGKTRVPSGTYEIELRTEGHMTTRYLDRYGPIHKGMLWLRNVKNFKYVYIHIGNTEDDTDGCILLGSGCTARTNEQNVTGSALAYLELYPRVAKEILAGEKVTIEII